MDNKVEYMSLRKSTFNTISSECKFGLKCKSKKCFRSHFAIKLCKNNNYCFRSSCTFRHNDETKRHKNKELFFAKNSNKCIYGNKCLNSHCSFSHRGKSETNRSLELTQHLADVCSLATCPLHRDDWCYDPYCDNRRCEKRHSEKRKTEKIDMIVLKKQDVEHTQECLNSLFCNYCAPLTEEQKESISGTHEPHTTPVIDCPGCSHYTYTFIWTRRSPFSSYKSEKICYNFYSKSCEKCLKNKEDLKGLEVELTDKQKIELTPYCIYLLHKYL